MLEKLEARNSKLSPDEKELYKKIHSLGDDELRRQLLDNLMNEEGE